MTMKADERQQLSSLAKFCLGMAVVAECIGIFFAIVAGYFFVAAFPATGVARHQLGIGVAMSVIFAFGAFLLAALLMLPAKCGLSRRLYAGLQFPCFVAGVVFLIGVVAVLLDTLGLISI